MKGLSPARLLEIGGETLYAAGRALVNKGRVVRWEVGSRGLEGVVRGRGGVQHEVRLSVDDPGLEAECSCAHYAQEGFCEHLVALALAWLKEKAPELLDTQARPERDTEPLLEWMRTRGILHLSGAHLLELESFLPKRADVLAAFQGLTHLQLTSLLDGTLTFTRRDLILARPVLEQAAWARLDAEIELVRQGLAHERQHPEPPLPTDERLVPLVRALGRMRALVRERAMPRLLPASALRLGFVEEPPVFHVHEPMVLFNARTVLDEAMHQQCVKVEPLRILGGEEILTCSRCNAQGFSRCVHALTALDLVLGALGDRRREAENARLAERLFVTTGRKLLDALDKARLLAEPRAVSGESLQVSFRLEAVEGPSPRLRPYLHRALKRGGLSKGTPMTLRDLSEVRGALEVPEELEALELCLSMDRQSGSSERHPLLVRTLKLLAHSPRLVLDSRLETPLRVRSLPLGFSIEEPEEAAGGLWVQPDVGGTRVGNQAREWWRLKAPQPWFFVEPEVPRLTLVSASPAALAVLEVVLAQGGRLSAAWKPDLLDRLGGVEMAMPLSLPPSLEGREVPPESGLLVRLRPTGGESLGGSLLVRPLPEAPPRVPGEGVEVLRGLRAGERVRTRRDLHAERTEAAALTERLELPLEEQGRFSVEGAEAALGLIERLEPLTGPSLRVEWEERPWSLVHLSDAKGLKVAVRREHDWFGVKGAVEVDGARVELAVLLDALRRDHRYVPLAPGRWLRITETLREQLMPLADVAHGSRGRWEVSAAAAPVLESLSAAGAEVHVPADWRRLAHRIREAQAMEVAVPAGLQAELRDYQREGFVWMARLTEWGGGGCLADDMGLGKTLQALALLLHRAERGPALVVAPTSVCFNWVREAARFAPSLRVHAYREAERTSLLSGLGAGDVVVVSYTLLMLEAERFAGVSFATLILDEAQAVKNPDTARAKAVRALQSEARMALSGTPVENRLAELWSLFRLVFPGLLGSRESFRERFAAPIEREKDPRARGALARLVRPFLLRRTKAEVARELPARVETVVPVTLSASERRLYEDTRLAALARLAEAEGQEKRFLILAALTRLRLAACHRGWWTRTRRCRPRSWSACWRWWTRCGPRVDGRSSSASSSSTWPWCARPWRRGACPCSTWMDRPRPPSARSGWRPSSGARARCSSSR